jgi:hypothetical protein
MAAFMLAKPHLKPFLVPGSGAMIFPNDLAVLLVCLGVVGCSDGIPGKEAFRNSGQGLDQSFYSCPMSGSDQFSIGMGGQGARGLNEREKGSVLGRWYVRAKA